MNDGHPAPAPGAGDPLGDGPEDTSADPRPTTRDGRGRFLPADPTRRIIRDGQAQMSRGEKALSANVTRWLKARGWRHFLAIERAYQLILARREARDPQAALSRRTAAQDRVVKILREAGQDQPRTDKPDPLNRLAKRARERQSAQLQADTPHVPADAMSAESPDASGSEPEPASGT